jgi:hypothetical protein
LVDNEATGLPWLSGFVEGCRSKPRCAPGLTTGVTRAGDNARLRDPSGSSEQQASRP